MMGRGTKLRRLSILCGAAVIALVIGPQAAFAQKAPAKIERQGVGTFPISTSVSVPAGSRIVYISGTVPAVMDESAPQGSVQRFGDTETQTRSVIGRIKEALEKQGMGLGDVVMMRVFLTAPPGTPRQTGRIRQADIKHIKAELTIDVPNKAKRVENFHRGTVASLADLLAAAGYSHPSELSRRGFYRRAADGHVISFADQYQFPNVQPMPLLRTAN